MAGRGAMHLYGAEELRQMLTDAMKIAEEEGREGIKKLAGNIALGAQQRAPEKTGQLVDAIKVRHEYFSPRRFRSTVWVDEMMAPYAIYMHEGINGMPYELGEISEDKNEGKRPHYGEGVGWKFLKRAFNAETRKASKRLREALDAAERKVRNAARSVANRVTSKVRNRRK